MDGLCSKSPRLPALDFLRAGLWPEALPTSPLPPFPFFLHRYQNCIIGEGSLTYSCSSSLSPLCFLHKYLFQEISHIPNSVLVIESHRT